MTLPLNIVPKPTLEIQHHKIHEGNHFTVHTTTSVPASTSKYFLIIPPPIQPDGSIIEIHIIFEVDVLAGVIGKLEFFENPTITGNGTPLNIINNNRRSPTLSQAQVFEDPTVTFDNPPPLFTANTPGTGGVVGDFNRDEEEFLLNENFNYVLKFTNTDLANPTDINLDLNWYDNRPSSPT
jgi:hypothetical protein